MGSSGAPAAVAGLRRGRESYRGDERILGSAEFMEAVRREMAASTRPAVRPLPLAELVRRVSQARSRSDWMRGGRVDRT